MRVRIGWSSLPAILCLLYVVGCLGALVLSNHPDSVMKKLTPPAAESEARTYVDWLRANQLDQIEKNLDPSIVDEYTHRQLALMASMVPSQQPLSVKVVGVHATGQANLAGATSSELNITLEYEYPGKWLLANLVTRRQNGAQTIIGFRVNELPDSLEHSNRLTFAGKGPENYVILIMFLTDMGLTLFVLVRCVENGLNRKNWFWPIVCLFGIGRFAVNWTTGEVNVAAIWIGFPPAGANGTFYSPWTVYAALPLGAILFLLFNRPQQQREQASPSSIPADGPLPGAPAEQPDSPSAAD